MKKTGMLVCLAVALVPVCGSAQLEVYCRLKSDRVLQFEPVMATITVNNLTAVPVDISGSDGKAQLGFDIERTPGILMRPSSSSLFDRPVVVSPRQKQTEEVDITQGYDLHETGPYTIVARVEMDGKLFMSARCFIDVLPGLEIGRLAAGYPGGGSSVRTYTLRTLNRNRADYVFVRVDDEAMSRCFGVIELGRIVRLFQPVMQIDDQGNVHVLHQSGPRQYTRSVVSPFGTPVSREVYTAEANEISMGESESGDIRVMKGDEPATPIDDSTESDEDPLLPESE